MKKTIQIADNKKTKLVFSEKLNDIFSSNELELKNNDLIVISKKQRSILFFLENFKSKKVKKEIILCTSSIDKKNIENLFLKHSDCKIIEIFVDEKKYKKLEFDFLDDEEKLNYIKKNKENSHIKVLLFNYGNSFYVICGSGNAVTGGAKHEHYFISKNKELYNFFKKQIYENIQ